MSRNVDSQERAARSAFESDDRFTSRGAGRKARLDAITWLSPPVSMKGKIAKELNSAAFRPQARRTGVLATACLRRGGRHQRPDPLRERGFAERALRLEQLHHFDHELVHVRILCG